MDCTGDTKPEFQGSDRSPGAAKRYPNGEPEWLKYGSRYDRFMHYAPLELFIFGGALAGGVLGFTLYLLWAWAART
jgi:hypothetical protein